jgi:hypothetical protein
MSTTSYREYGFSKINFCEYEDFETTILPNEKKAILVLTSFIEKKVPIESEGGFTISSLIRKVYEIYKKEVEGYLFLSISGFIVKGNEIYANVK